LKYDEVRYRTQERSLVLLVFQICRDIAKPWPGVTALKRF
jgi:hypothetical protein